MVQKRGKLKIDEVRALKRMGGEHNLYKRGEHNTILIKWVKNTIFIKGENTSRKKMAVNTSLKYKLKL